MTLSAKLAAAAFIGASALAFNAAAMPTGVRAGTYKVEPNHTQVIFTVNHLGFSPYSGVFSNASGTLAFDPAKPEASKLSVTIPIDSVMTTSTKLNGELVDKDWFDAGAYPTATFESTKVTMTGKDSATVAGNFTLHGVTRPLTLKARVYGGGTNTMSGAYTLGFEATGTVKRSAYGVKNYVPMIGDDVALTINGAFELQK
jgi:polyisoprenoid-binding protein YceI